MASSPVGIHLNQLHATLDDLLDVPEPAAATMVPAGVEYAEKLNFDETNEIVLFKKKNCKVHMGVYITPKILLPTLSFSNTGLGPSPVRAFFFSISCRERMRSIHNICLKSASNSTVNVNGETFSFSNWEIYPCVSALRPWTFSQYRNWLEHLSSTGLSRDYSPWNDASSTLDLAGLQLFQNTRCCRDCWLYYRTTRMVRPIPTTDRTVAKEHRWSE